MDSSLHQQFQQLERNHWWFQARRHIVASVLRNYLAESGRPQRRIFDAGCGTGEMTDMLREFGTVAGIDSSPEAVRACRERFGDAVDVRVGELPDDLPPPGEVDLVTAFDVLEHLDDDMGALERIHRVLPEGGALAVTVPAFQFLWGPHDVINAHRRRYTRRELRRRLEAVGFVVDRITYFNTWLFPPVALVRGLRRLSRHSQEPRSDFTFPHPFLNRLLQRVFASEAALLRRASLPVGVSILSLCRKPEPGGLTR